MFIIRHYTHYKLEHIAMADNNRFFEEGMTLYNAEKYEEAIDLFTQALAKEMTHVGSLYQRGLSHTKLRNFDQAFRDFNQAIAFAPHIAAIYSERGVVYYHQKDYKKAMQDMDKAVALEPQEAYRYASRAYLRAAVGDKLGALNDYRKALELDPNDAIVQNNLGLLEESMGYSKDAHKRYEEADRLMGISKEEQQKRFDKIVEDHKIAEASRKMQQDAPPPVVKPQTKDYFQVMKSVFTSKERFGEFKDFVKGKFGKKKS